MKNKMNLLELKGLSLITAISKMFQQLLSDGNELEDITLERIFDEIDSVEIYFNENGNIILGE